MEQARNWDPADTADGYMEDYYTDIDYGDTDRTAVVGQLRWHATDDLTVDFIALWGKRKENAVPNTCVNVNTSAILQTFASTTTGTHAEFCVQSESLVKDEKVIQDSTGLEVALFAQNFTDEFYYGTGTVEAARLGVASRIRGKPRNYGIDVFYRW
jgi:hypothetical protein